MDDPTYLLFFEYLSQQFFFAQVPFDQFELRILDGTAQIPAFQGRIIKVIEIIQADNPMSLHQEPFHQMGPDEAGAAGH
jgi:hypothetical protein